MSSSPSWKSPLGRGGGVGHRHRERLLASPRRPARGPPSRSASTSTPSSATRALWRSIGSLRRHSSTCSLGTYFMSSCAAWPCMRIVTASMSVGPPPEIARSRASQRGLEHRLDVVAVDAARPGSRRPRRARPGRRRTAASSGVEYAYWLFSRTKMTGSRCTPAQFIASWKSPRDVEPSPNQVIAQRALVAQRNAIAMPVATSIMSGSIETMPTQPFVWSPKWTLPSRPRVMPSARPMYWARIRAGSTPRTRCAPRSRCRMHRRSCGGHRERGADRHRLLAEAVVEGAGDLALAVEVHRALLDRAHEQHVPQQRDAVLERQVLRHGGGVLRPLGGARGHRAVSFPCGRGPGGIAAGGPAFAPGTGSPSGRRASH